MSRPRRNLAELASVAVLLSVLIISAQPGVVYASCNPGRPQGPAGWKSGIYKYSIEPWGVHADLEGYAPYVPNLASGAASIVTIVMAEGASWWIQPGWWMVKNVSGWPDGYHSAVQFWDPFGTTTDFFGYDFFQGQQDQVPDPGTLARYAATTSFDGGSGLFEIDVKLAGVCCVPYETAISYDSAQVFGEILNSAAQFPGGVNDHVRLRTVGWRNPNLVWHGIDDDNPNPPPRAELGWSHPGSYSYDVWDKACSS